MELYATNARAAEERLAALERRAAEPPPPPPPDPKSEAGKFWTDPVTVLRGEIDRAVKPLNDFRTSFERQAKVDELKAQVRADPRFKDIFEKGEQYIDQAIRAMPEVTREGIMSAALSIRGAAALGMLPGLSFEAPAPAPAPPAPGTPPAPGAPPVSTVPPHLRPSAPPPPSAPEPPRRRELTENEKRVARENGMDEEEYLEFLELPPDQVVSYVTKREKAAQAAKGGK